MSSRGRGRGRGHRTPTKDPPSRTPTGRGMRRSTSGDRSPGTKDPMVLKHTEATQTASCKDQEGLKPPRRPGYGKEGSEIALRVNRFSVNVAIDTIHHYDVKFDPEPRKAKDNMKIMQTLTKEFSARLGGSKPAYDGKANLFTAKLLPFTNKEAIFHVTLKLDPDDREEKVFKVVIRWVADVNVSQLKDVISGKTQSFPFDVLQALDIIIRMTPRLRFHPVGRSVFRPPDPMAEGTILLGQGREVWFGYHQSIRPSMWSLDLTVNVSATAFYEDCSALDFLHKVLNLRCEQITGRLNDRDRIKFLREIKGLKVAVTHLGKQKQKYSVIDITRNSADSLVFPLIQEDGKTVDCTVAKYFFDRYAIKLEYPLLPCLQVAPKEKNRFLPIEVCRIAPGQRCVKKLTEQQTAQMIRRTARSPSDREQEIKQIISEASFSNDPYVQEFGLAIDPTMCKVTGRVLPAPHLNTGGNELFTPEKGVWNMREKTFFEGKTINCWALLSFASEREFDKKASRWFSTQLQRISKTLNMPITGGPSFTRYVSSTDQLGICFKKMLKEFGSDLELIIAITSPRVRGGYDELKRLGDLVYAIPTQCIQLRRAQECNLQVLTNICLKLNAKLDGTNFVISSEQERRSRILKEPVIFLGADVTHPAQGERDDRFPSIAAVVGSMDRHACKYAGRVCIQKHRQEIISDLTDMVKELLEEFRKQTKKIPKRIIFYRDGVSEGQFQQVLVEELRAIQAACKLFCPEYNPGITIVIVQKRHHTRFFPVNPKDQTGKSGNVPAGTVVDRDIVHPSEFDFFLCSHYGVQGTSRPTHYHVLWDDNVFTADELQSLTYQLCSVYVRCTRSVSLPAPVYYAHLAAYRARCYQDTPVASAKPHLRLNPLRMMYFV